MLRRGVGAANRNRPSDVRKLGGEATSTSVTARCAAEVLTLTPQKAARANKASTRREPTILAKRGRQQDMFDHRDVSEVGQVLRQALKETKPDRCNPIVLVLAWVW